MSSLVPVLTLLAAVVVSLIVLRVATVALTLTGLSHDLARFEARSAFTGSGYTTSDSEKIVSHPVRRRVIMMLMLVGNAGIITVMTSAVLSFAGRRGDNWWDQWYAHAVFLAIGLSLLWMLAHSQWVDDQLSRTIKWALHRFTHLDVSDYVGLLHLSRGYSVVSMSVDEGNWFANKSLTELRLSDEGVLVLGIERKDGHYLGAPKGQTILEIGDMLLVYGPQEILVELNQRQTGYDGQLAHRRAVEQNLRDSDDDDSPSDSPDI